MTLPALLPGVRAHLERRGDDSIVATCEVASDHPDYDGHFDEKPVLPACSQFDILEAIVRKALHPDLRFSGAPRVKFLGIIAPGDAIDIVLTRVDAASAVFDFVISANGGTRARGRIHFALQAPCGGAAGPTTRVPSDVQ
jgi:3-hydroxymyristoyl/3-hydroxydecanoyl-(acyl carrier protein) dehydratase